MITLMSHFLCVNLLAVAVVDVLTEEDECNLEVAEKGRRRIRLASSGPLRQKKTTTTGGLKPTG